MSWCVPDSAGCKAAGAGSGREHWRRWWHPASRQRQLPTCMSAAASFQGGRMPLPSLHAALWCALAGDGSRTSSTAPPRERCPWRPGSTLGEGRRRLAQLLACWPACGSHVARWPTLAKLLTLSCPNHQCVYCLNAAVPAVPCAIIIRSSLRPSSQHIAPSAPAGPQPCPNYLPCPAARPRVQDAACAACRQLPHPCAHLPAQAGPGLAGKLLRRLMPASSTPHVASLPQAAV